ncbi:unnamed protein product [Didymodactylos carnosus]|uniref:Uncharacterized protein n=1 Tax=Didymodactylos carnosus TaxID=1234261 RepID=A0A815RPG8_9BILA|nr:unnamed protein product [Didymodactylos carnosus]CAF4344511.1 unnamed protein product [Didymodactylos carnosus]
MISVGSAQPGNGFGTLFGIVCTTSVSLSFDDTEIDLSTCSTINTSDGCWINFIVDYPANSTKIMFSLLPGDLLYLTNGEYPLITHSATIWLDKQKFTRSMSYVCFNGDECGLNYTQQLFNETRTLNYEYIINGLSDLLVGENTTATTNNDLACYNQYDKEVSCPGGVCQIISTWFDSNKISVRSCVKKGSMSTNGIRVHNDLVHAIRQILSQNDPQLLTSLSYTSSFALLSTTTTSLPNRFSSTSLSSLSSDFSWRLLIGVTITVSVCSIKHWT